MTDISSKVVLITGATDGLGRGIARTLAARGATLLVHGRDAARIEAVASELSRDGARHVRTYRADLASLAEVQQLARAVRDQEPRLDVLVNNAGIGTQVPSPSRDQSRDGIELRFAVNYLSHYLLTRELVPLLVKSAPARVVNVSSAGQAAIDFADPMLTRGYNGIRAYCQSKLAQILFTVDLARELASSNVTVNALHPATFMPTKIVPHPTSTLEEGVDATVRLIADPSMDGVTGKYFDGVREARADAQAYDDRARSELHALSERLVSEALARRT
jgi:NAD(P)-dependent dehydrogenase (short-subunit alcohol dehydrogenase family)